jgi:hypothetical protein
MSDAVVPATLSADQIADLSQLFPFRNEYRDNKEGSAIRERFLPACFAGPLKAFNEYQIRAIPKGWLQIKSLDGEVIGACYPSVIYSDDKSRNLINETFKIELTPEQQIAAIDAEEAKELEVLMARMRAKKLAVLSAATAAADPLIAAVQGRAVRPPV